MLYEIKINWDKIERFVNILNSNRSDSNVIKTDELPLVV